MIDRFSHDPFQDLHALVHRSDGLWIGYLGYDLGRWAEPAAYRQGLHTADAIRGSGWPVIELAYCPGYLVYDGLERRWWACGALPVWGLDLGDLEPRFEPVVTGPLRETWGRADYESAAQTVKEHIARGDVFQVNLAHRLMASWSNPSRRSSRAVYHPLATGWPAWYGAYLELAPERGHDEPVDPAGRPARAIASGSPELFLQVRGRDVVTRPIKGTRPAAVGADQLRASEKDAAELNMIVDVLRNDLGRVCAYGSVRVPRHRQIESHPTVHHGVATIQGQLHPSKDIVDLLRATLPGGSITGAPKVRAMQIIEGLEPVLRGPYCGCIGYLSRRQTSLNVAIRTLLLDPGDGERGQIDFSVGSGIVADSDPSSEYLETLDKAAAMIGALAATSGSSATEAKKPTKRDLSLAAGPSIP